MIRALALGAATLAGLVTCVNAPTVAERNAQRIVVTQFDPDAGFASYTTFAVPDSIVAVSALDAGSDASTPVAAAIADPTLGAIATELTQRGYVQVERSAEPDLGVAVTALTRQRVEAVSYGDWWGVGSAAPAFWGVGSTRLQAPFDYETTAWQSGALIVELDDLRAARAGATLTVVWAGLVYGVTGAAETPLTTPPISEIQQLFAQAPYLHR
jgi:hypothetical protein